MAESIKSAINEKYLDKVNGIYASGTQTELSVPLLWGVVPDELKDKVAARLAEKVAETDYHIDCGVLGAKAVLNALSENGYSESAYMVATQNTYPSWGWWVVNGATTLLENWDLEATRDISDNHMMFGEIGAWFYKGLAGIRPDASGPGFRCFRLEPYFAEGLPSFEASHNSPNGEIKSSWERKGKKVIYRVRVPSNSKALLTLDAKKVKSDSPYALKQQGRTWTAELYNGEWTFEIQL